MASGDTIFILGPANGRATGTLFATRDEIVDGSTPTTVIEVLDFDASTAEHYDWEPTVPSNYGGGGFTVSWKGGTDADDVGTFILEVRMIVIADATILTGDLAIDGATPASITDTPPTTPINKMNQAGTDTLTHSEAGSPAVGNRVIIRATRNTGTDTNTGDLQLQEILMLEA